MYINWNETMKKENKSFLKECLIILFVGVIVNAGCFFLCSFTGHCSTLTDSQYFPFLSSENPNNIYYNSEFIEEQFNNGAVFIKVYPDNRGRNRLWYAVLTDITYSNADDSSVLLAEINNNLYQFSLFWYPSAPLTYKAKFYYEDLSNHSFTLSSTDNNTLGQFYSMDSTLYNNNNLYFAKYSIEYNTYGSGQYVIVVADNINVGDFSELPEIDEILNNISNSWQPPSSVTGHALPSSPTENPNNTPFQERKEFFEYIANTITQNFGNLGYNLVNWFNGIQQKLTDGFNSVSQNIYNGFKTLMDNIKDFFGTKLDFIIDKFNYITEPLSLEDLTTNLNNCSFSSDLLGVIVSVESFKSSFTSGTEPNSCSFTLDFSNAFYNFGVCTFSLDWLLPIRPIIRLFLGGLCVYSLIVSIFTSLNTYIGGTSSINDDI